MPRLHMHMAGLGNTATIMEADLRVCVKEKNGQKRNCAALSVTPVPSQEAWTLAIGNLLEASGWGLMKVTFVSGNHLLQLLYKDGGKRARLRGSCREGVRPAASDQLHRTHHAKGSRGPPGAPCSEDHQKCALCLATS